MTMESKNLGHLGLIAGMCDDLDLVSLLDTLIPCTSAERKISTGLCVKALLMNCLGFTSRRLYLTPEFFSDKPIAHLLGEGITADCLNDDRLGRCLDDLYSFGLTKLFSIICQRAYQVLDLSSQPQFYHLDSTSFHLDGTYNQDSYQADDTCIHITKGYSRDHRPDLNQVCLNLIVENSAGLPLFMEALSGNSSDKKTFVESIKTFTAQLTSVPTPRCWVADSALYSAENIQNLSQMGCWLTRVPETIKEVKDLITNVLKDKMEHFFEESLSDYRYQNFSSIYGGIAQDWLLVFSKKAYEREIKTLAKSFHKSSLQESEQFIKLCQQTFSCQQDAQNRLTTFEKKSKYITLSGLKIVAIEGYLGKGKPKKDASKVVKGYQIQGQCGCLVANYEAQKKKLGFFVLASPEKDLTPSQKLLGYKGQANAEKGFRFLKDPSFQAATIFVKKHERVEAVLMLMCLSLLIYTALEIELRKALKKNQETLPNQVKKEIQNPTMKWIFALLIGIHCLYIEDQKQPILLNIKDIHRKIIKYLSPNIRKYYNLE